MNSILFLHDFVEANGKTVKENNLARQHNIPKGTLVEVKYDAWFGNGACEKVHARLWVVEHNRDCDGTPLYVLSQIKDYGDSKRFGYLRCGFGEERLTPIEVTDKLVYGEGVLEWEE